MKSEKRRGTVGRLLKTMFTFYPVTIGCIIFNAVVSSFPSVFMQNIIAVVEENWQKGNWDTVSGKILGQ